MVSYHMTQMKLSSQAGLEKSVSVYLVALRHCISRSRFLPYRIYDNAVQIHSGTRLPIYEYGTSQSVSGVAIWLQHTTRITENMDLSLRYVCYGGLRVRHFQNAAHSVIEIRLIND